MFRNVPRLTASVLLSLGVLCSHPSARASENSQPATTDAPAFKWSPSSPLNIVIPEKASKTERFAAEELKSYLSRITGKTPGIVTSEVPNQPSIILGRHDKNQELNWADLSPDEFIIEVKPERIQIVGGMKPSVFDKSGREYPQERGTLYGVYELLEKLGVRWYRPEPWGENVPTLSNIEIPAGRQKHSPAYPYRSGLNIYCYNADATLQQHEMAALWATRNRMNTNMWTPPEYGGYYRHGFYHSYIYYVPSSKYFKTHPEYFALIDGKRSSDVNAQLCLSNPDVFKLIIDGIVKNVEEDPNTGVVSLDPNDLALWCQCEDCKAMDDPNSKDAYGISMSNRVVKFNNQVAKEIATRLPGVKVGWLAYNRHALRPSQADTIEPNTMVQIAAFAGAYSDFSRTLHDKESKPNQQFLKIISDYGKLTEIGVYEYWSDYAWPGPLPLMNVMLDRLKHYRDYNVKSVYSEMHPGWGPQGISHYFYTRLLWDPNRDISAELEDYYRNFYGPAAAPMKAFHEKVEEAGKSGKYYGSGGSEAGALFTKDILRVLDENVSEAERLTAGKEPYERRIKGIRAGLDFAIRYREVVDLKNAGEAVEASEKLKELKEFFLAQPTGEVFENGPALTKMQGGYYMVFDDLEKELNRSASLFKSFEGAKLVQQHDTGWRFSTDPEDKGRKEKWYGPSHADEDWTKVSATGWWQSQGFPDYQGVTWYRKKFQAPLATNGKRTVAYFGAVDGDAEVWLNGTKLGEHILGAEGKGYDEPFFFDMTDHLDPENPNLLSIRVKKDFAVGGINKGVKIYSVDKILSPAE